MSKYSYVIFIIFTSLSGKSIQSLDLTLYPEYYYSGIMIQVKGEADEDMMNSSFEFSVPAILDSAFLFKSIDGAEPILSSLKSYFENNNYWIKIPITQKRYAFFLFYNPIDISKEKRNFEYNIMTNVFVDSLNCIIQEPIGCSEFNLSEINLKQSSNQHGFIFHEININNLAPFEGKNILGSYKKSTSLTSMELLASILQPQSSETSKNNGDQVHSNSDHSSPLRHRLPLWEPLAVLFGLSIFIGILFIKSNKNESSPQAFLSCSNCGLELRKTHNFCPKCGSKSK